MKISPFLCNIIWQDCQIDVFLSKSKEEQVVVLTCIITVFLQWKENDSSSDSSMLF